MTKLSQIAALLILAAFASGSSCADTYTPREQQQCVVDEECGEESFCYSGECTQGCASDEDCFDGEVCRAELRMDQDDIVDVCVADSASTTNNGARCDIDACVESLDDTRARCGADGFCFIPELVYGLLIIDRTPVNEPEFQSLDEAPGADIAAVYLADPNTGEPVAWAETLDLAPANNVAPRNAPAGDAVPLTEDLMCVEAPYEAATTPLGGEGGLLMVRFLETQTRTIVTTPPEDWDVVVVEWGDNCGVAGDPDLYELWACEATSFKSMDAGRDCFRKISGPHAGRTAVDGMEK